MKFKIGDRVRIIKRPKECWHGCSCFMGLIGKVCQINGEKIGVNAFPGEDRWCSSFREDSMAFVSSGREEIIYAD